MGKEWLRSVVAMLVLLITGYAQARENFDAFEYPLIRQGPVSKNSYNTQAVYCVPTNLLLINDNEVRSRWSGFCITFRETPTSRRDQVGRPVSLLEWTSVIHQTYSIRKAGRGRNGGPLNDVTVRVIFPGTEVVWPEGRFTITEISRSCGIENYAIDGSNTVPEGFLDLAAADSRIYLGVIDRDRC